MLALLLLPLFTGHWTLDRAQSRNLPDFYARVRSHELTVARSDSALDVGVVIDVGASKPDSLRFVYRLDGGATDTQTLIRTPDGMRPIPTRLSGTVAADGSLHLVIARAPFAPGAKPGVGTEDWSLSADGATLTVHRVETMPDGRRMEGDMVFRRG